MIRVMIVEDDASTGALLVQLVKRLWPGASVALEGDALSAIEQWRTTGADLILLDWGLPGMNGLEVLKQIRRSGSKTICVMISGHADREVILAARIYQIAAFIVKPFTAKQVMARLSEIMALPQASPSDAAFDSIADDIEFHLTHGTLGLPIDPELVDAIEGIRSLDAAARARLLRQCQFHPALVFRLLTLANTSQYIRGMDSVETFDRALQLVGLKGFINLAVEMSLYPGSHLQADFLRKKRLELHRDALTLAETITRLSADVPTFNLNAARTVSMIYRVGELSLLQLMQSWLDQGHALDESACTAILTAQSARAGNVIKTQWNLPNTIRRHIGSVYLLPSGTVRIDAIIMRIAGLLLAGEDSQELARLLSRAGLDERQLERYRPLPE